MYYCCSGGVGEGTYHHHTGPQETLRVVVVVVVIVVVVVVVVAASPLPARAHAHAHAHASTMLRVMRSLQEQEYPHLLSLRPPLLFLLPAHSS